jgi:diguanylate cyclase (GGDEF)-like protein
MAISVMTVTRYIERESRDDVAILANDAAQAFDHQMSRYFRMSDMAAGLDFLRLGHISPAAKRALLANLQTVFPDCLWIGITDTKGVVQVSGDRRLEGASVKDMPWFIEGLRRPMITPLHGPLDNEAPLHGAEEDQRVIDIARPLRDLTGNLIGVLDMTVSWKWALEFRNLLLRNRNNAIGIDIIITDRDGRVLIGPDSLSGATLTFAANRETLPAGEASPLVSAIFHNPDMNRKAELTGALDQHVVDWPDGGDYISAVGTGTGYQDFPGLGWNIVVRQPRAIAYAPADVIRDRLATGGALLAILFAGIGWVVADRVTHSIRRLTRHARRLALGDRGIAFSSPRGSREVAVLGETLDNLVENLLQREQQLLDLNANLESRIAERTALLAATNRSLEEEMAQRQAVETERETLIRQLRDQAEHDSLTGALNRRAFLVMAERDRRRQRRDGGRLAVIMFDIDHFKRVNDSYGHATGDEVIRQVAAIATATVRDSDLFCRYGGEEFALLIADPGADRAMLVAERLRKQVAALHFAVPGPSGADAAATGPAENNRAATDRMRNRMPVGHANAAPEGFQITISLGVTLEAADALPEDGVTMLLDRADQALYAAKRGGRNRTVTDRQSEGHLLAHARVAGGEPIPGKTQDMPAEGKSAEGAAPTASINLHMERPSQAANDG